MAKFQVVILLAFVLAVAHAEPQRRLAARQRNRFLARQEAAVVDEVTPYPSADELKPEVPFSDGVEPEVPLSDAPAEEEPSVFVVEPQPDEVYGPPEVSENHLPDEVYGPPESEVVAADPAAEELSAGGQSARLTAARRAASLRQRQAYRKASYRKAVAAQRPAKLRAAAVASNKKRSTV